jgi:hypothetical protein
MTREPTNRQIEAGKATVERTGLHGPRDTSRNSSAKSGGPCGTRTRMRRRRHDHFPSRRHRPPARRPGHTAPANTGRVVARDERQKHTRPAPYADAGTIAHLKFGR